MGTFPPACLLVCTFQGGSGAVKELWVRFQGEAQPNHGMSFTASSGGGTRACANEEKSIWELK